MSAHTARGKDNRKLGLVYHLSMEETFRETEVNSAVHCTRGTLPRLWTAGQTVTLQIHLNASTPTKAYATSLWTRTAEAVDKYPKELKHSHVTSAVSTRTHAPQTGFFFFKAA